GCRGNPGPAGSGAVLQLPDGRRVEVARSLGRGTNNLAELTAIRIVLEVLDQLSIPGDATVAVLTDSSYSHGVLCKGWKAKKNTELILGIRAMLKQHPGVTLYWVAGHVGTAGNERADALANMGVAGTSVVKGLEA
ncbi:MAG: ribonuclease HI, partial [Kiritimatiellia bacterium]